MINARPMTIRDLLKTHPEYDAAHLEKLADFYEGGRRFTANKDKYLRPRQNDSNPAYRKARMASAHYTPHMSGKVDDLIGGILRTPPAISVANPSDSRAEYWLSLMRNADGSGRDMAAVTRGVLLQSMLPARAYFLIRTPQIEAIEGELLAPAKARGRLDCSIASVPASTVDDWLQSDDGEFQWIRTHCVELERAGDIGPAIKETHRWAYFEADAVTVYEASRPVENDKPEPWDQDKSVPPVQKPHGLKIIPLIPVEIPEGFNLGDRMLPIAEALFNREAALEFALDTGAFALPYIVTDKAADQVPMSELAILNVGVGGSFNYASPDGTVFDANAKDAKKLLDDLDSALQAMAEKASASNDRTSGVAQQQFRAPKEVLMSLYAMPTLDALAIAVNAIAVYRGEESLAPKVEGLDDFDTQGTEIAIANTLQFVTIPQMPLKAKQLAIKRVVADFIPDINQDDQAEIEKQIEAITDEPPPMPGQTQTSNSALPLNVKTGQVDGTGADQIRQKQVVR